MNTFTPFIILTCMILVFISTFGCLFLLGSKKLLKMKYLLLGFVSYFITNGFILPFISTNLHNMIPSYSALIMVLAMALSTIIVKKFLYFIAIDHQHTEAYISSGMGEAFFEIVFSIYPVFLNAIVYCIQINNDTLYNSLSEFYTNNEITQIMNNFISIPNTYYITIMFSTLIIISIHLCTAILIQKKIKFRYLLLLCIVLYGFNGVIPAISYELYIISFILLSTMLFFVLKKKYSFIRNSSKKAQ